MSSSSNALRAESLAELLAYWDKAFVERAYWTLLGRAPDPEGGSHYLGQIRSGVSKLTVLLRLRESREGSARDVKVAGLDAALARHRDAIRPYSGTIVRLFTGREGNSGGERQRRAIANQLAALEALGDPLNGSSAGLSAHSMVPKSAPIGLAAGTEIGMVDHLLMRMVRVEASLKRIEDKLKASATNVSGGKVGRRL